MPDPTAPPSYDALQLIAEGVAALTGAALATVSVVRDDGRVEVVAWAGDRDATQDAQLELPLRDLDGVVRGRLAAQLRDGVRLPDDQGHRTLDAYAAYAARAVVAFLERERMADQLRLAEAARHAVRQASEHRSLQHVLETARPALLEGLQALGMWIQTFDEDGLGRGTVYSADGRTIDFTERAYAISRDLARILWENQHTTVLSSRHPSRLLSRADTEEVEEFIAGLAVESVLMVPVGAGHQVLGVLALTRDASAPEWSATEAAAAMDIGRDLGVAVHSVRSAEREQRLVRELQVLEARLSAVTTSRPVATDVGAAPAVDLDRARTRAALREASDALEQVGRRRDAQARILADAQALGEPPAAGALDVYRTLRAEYRDAHLFWQVAFDAWQEVSAREEGS